MSGDESVTSWLRQLEAGDEDAARLLWQPYYRELERCPSHVASDEAGLQFVTAWSKLAFGAGAAVAGTLSLDLAASVWQASSGFR